MPEILIDFDVFKALTARRINESHTYNDVIRDLLGLDSLQEPPEAIEALLEVSSHPGNYPRSFFAPPGFSSRGLFLPNGTELRATYQQQVYGAKIDAGKWVNGNGNVHTSPSSAAKDVTGTNVNGLRFWKAKRPNDVEWIRLDLVR
jgi:hypothetical protein